MLGILAVIILSYNNWMRSLVIGERPALVSLARVKWSNGNGQLASQRQGCSTVLIEMDQQASKR